MGTMASLITSLTSVYSAVHSVADQRKHQSSASLAFVRGNHRRPVNSPHKWPVTRKMFLFDDVIVRACWLNISAPELAPHCACRCSGTVPGYRQCWTSLLCTIISMVASFVLWVLVISNVFVSIISFRMTYMVSLHHYEIEYLSHKEIYVLMDMKRMHILTCNHILSHNISWTLSDPGYKTCWQFPRRTLWTQTPTVDTVNKDMKMMTWR